MVSNPKSSKPNSGQRSPIRQSLNNQLLKFQNKQNSKKQARSKSNRKRRNLSASIESADDPEINPVYIDTGGSNMQ